MNKRIVLFFVLALLLLGAPFVGSASAKKLEISLGSHFGLGSWLSTEQSDYSRSWKALYLEGVEEFGSISHSLNNTVGGDISLTYYFIKNIGLRLQFDLNARQNCSEGKLSGFYQIEWWYHQYSSYEGNLLGQMAGNLSTLPISLNLIFIPKEMRPFRPYLTAGISYFFSKFKADSIRGFGYTWWVKDIEGWGYDQYVDYVGIPIKIDQSLNSWGANLGVGLNVSLNQRIGLAIEAIYFLGPKATVNWLYVTGTYSGTEIPKHQVVIDEDAIRLLNAEAPLPPLEIIRSYFKLGIALSFSLF